MIVNTNEVIYDDGRESSIIHFSNNHIHAPIRIGSQLIIFSWCSSKKKGRHQMEVLPDVNFWCVWSFSNFEENWGEKKKRKDFHAKRHTFLKNARARASTHIHRSRQNEWEHGRRERQFCRQSWFGAGTRFASERTRAFFECGWIFFSPPPSASSSFSLLVTSFFFFCSSFFFFARRLIQK